MKGSTLHRSTLSEERMAMLENVKPEVKASIDFSSYSNQKKGSELDLLYKNVEKNFMHSKTVANIGKTPGVYLFSGFIAGVLFMLIVFGVVMLSSNIKSMPQIPSNVENTAAPAENAVVAEEKYTVERGDTLQKIVYKVYGRYDDQKVEEIQKLNDISNPARIQIGQVLIMPVSEESVNENKQTESELQ